LKLEKYSSQDLYGGEHRASKDRASLPAYRQAGEPRYR